MNKSIINIIKDSEWKPITERPPKAGDYLCFFYFDSEKESYIGQNTYTGSIWISEQSSIKYWKELPTSPKEYQ